MANWICLFWSLADVSCRRRSATLALSAKSADFYSKSRVWVSAAHISWALSWALGVFKNERWVERRSQIFVSARWAALTHYCLSTFTYFPLSVWVFAIFARNYSIVKFILAVFSQIFPKCSKTGKLSPHIFHSWAKMSAKMSAFSSVWALIWAPLFFLKWALSWAPLTIFVMSESASGSATFWWATHTLQMVRDEDLRWFA